MQIMFDMDINLSDWAKAIGYKIVGDKLVKEYRLEDFKEAVSSHIQAMLESGYSVNAIQERFFENDKYEFKIDFEADSTPIEEE